MSDNVSVKDSAGSTKAAAADELTDSSFSPKVSILPGNGSPSPIPISAGHYETVAASATDQVLGVTGATGDYLRGLWIVPATTGPGAVSVKDGAGSAITVYTGGTVGADLTPIWAPLGMKSTGGAWKVTTGANVSVIGVGTFTP